MQPPWPDAIWTGDDVDDVCRLCSGVYAIVDYWDDIVKVVDIELYIEYDAEKLGLPSHMRSIVRYEFQSVAGYDAHNHSLDGVKLAEYGWIDDEIVVLLSKYENWIVFRPRNN